MPYIRFLSRVVFAAALTRSCAGVPAAISALISRRLIVPSVGEEKHRRI